MEIDVYIDGFAKCLYHRETGINEKTYIQKRKSLIPFDQSGWLFDWRSVQLDGEGFPVYELFTKKDNELQGRIAFLPKEDFVYVKLVESAPHNIGHTGKYQGTGAHLFAYACKTSFELGFEGYVSFMAKTKLIEHYINTLGAIRSSSQGMIIPEMSAKRLVDYYYESEVLDGKIY